MHFERKGKERERSIMLEDCGLDKKEAMFKKKQHSRTCSLLAKLYAVKIRIKQLFFFFYFYLLKI